MGSVITDDTIEPLAYAVCNTDGVEGLSWAEVELCEVSKNKYENIKSKCLLHVKFLELKHLLRKTLLIVFFVKKQTKI